MNSLAASRAKKIAMSKVFKVRYNCEKCGVECTTTNHNLRYRDHYKNEYICQKCLIKLSKSKLVFDSIPSEFHYQIFNNEIDYELAVSYLIGVSTKLHIKMICKICNCISILRWNDLCRRKHSRYDNICLKCLNNLIQNDPSKLASNRLKSKSLWKNPKYRSKCIKAFELHNEKMQNNPEYAYKYRRKSNSVTGTININGQDIIFDSAYELLFIWHIRHQYKIRRCWFAIDYGGHFYHPDFLIIDNKGNRIIIEVKGFYQNHVEEKQKAAEEYIKHTGIADEYVLYDVNKLIGTGIVTGTGGARMWKQIREIYHEATITFTSPKHQRIAEIGVSRYRKESKNTTNI